MQRRRKRPAERNARNPRREAGFEGDCTMAKKRKTSPRRTASKPKSATKSTTKPDVAKPAATKASTPRKPPRRPHAAAKDDEMLNIILVVVVLITVALGVYYYQLGSHESVSASNPPAAMEQK